MAILYDSRWVARAADGTPYSGALLYVYQAGGLTPANLYTNAALSTPQTNPVVADANGRFAQVFASPDTYDCVLKTSGGVVIASYEDVTALGDETGTFSRDFVNSRFQVRGSSGVVHIEAGPPTGDDIGGSAVIGGWDGSQGEALTLDYATVTASVDMAVAGNFAVATPKKITEGGKRLSSVVYTEATSFSAVSNVDIELPNTPAGTIAWDIDVWGLVFSANDWIGVRLAYDGVPTFKTGASDYGYEYIHNAAGTYTAIADDAETYIRTMFLANSDANLLAHAQIRVVTVTSGNGYTNVSGKISGFKLAGTSAGTTALFTGSGLGNYGRATYLRFYVGVGGAGGTITGKYRVKALRGYGE